MLGVTVSGFDYHLEQITIDSLLSEAEGGSDYDKRERVESTVAKLRAKYGYSTLQRGVVMEDEKLSGLDIRGKKEETSAEQKKPTGEE